MAPYEMPEIIVYSQLLVNSFSHWTGRAMLQNPAATTDAKLFARLLYDAPFALVSHGTQPDPIFRYANQTALNLWKMPWEEFTQLPSRLSAQTENDIQSDRQLLLKKALQAGWVDDYRGIRISKNGMRFEIKDTTLWNVVDASGERHGQAALIRNWRYL